MYYPIPMVRCIYLKIIGLQSYLFRWAAVGFYVIFVLLFGVRTFAETAAYRITAPEYSIQKTPEGTARIRMNGFGSTAVPGFPDLPSKIFHVAMGIPCEVLGVEIRVLNERAITDIDRIALYPPLMPMAEGDGTDDASFAEFLSNKQRVEKSDRYSPESPAEWIGVDRAGNLPLVKIRYAPFRYNPLSGILRLSPEIEVVVEYRPVSEANLSPMPSLAIPFDRFDRAHARETEPLAKPSGSASARFSRLLVITSQTIEKTLDTFCFWKRSLGDSVRVVSTESIYAETAGVDRAEKIRNFLKAEFGRSRVTDALLIGHNTILPVKKLYPDPSNHRDSGGVPSDLYFAELTGEWDGDKDGFPGEFGQDRADGVPEIRVGRIPWSDSTTVRNILERIIRFERTGGDWKRNALLIGGIANYRQEKNTALYTQKTDGACLMELLRSGAFSGRGAVTLYEKQGLDASVFNCSAPLDRAGVLSAWENGAAGCTTWWLHGSFDSATRNCWKSDDGDGIPESGELVSENLLSVTGHPANTEHPSVVFANACENGWPEKTSLGRELLRSTSAAVVAATRTTWYTLGWKDASDGGNASLTAEFWEAFAGQNASLGQAVAEAQWNYLSRFGSAWQHVQNAYATMLYGDPTLSLDAREPVAGTLTVRLLPDPSDPAAGQGSRVRLKDTAVEMVADASGAFAFGWIPGGTYTVEATGPGFGALEVRTDVRNGERNVLTVPLPRKPAAPLSVRMSVSDLDVTLQEGCSQFRTLKITNPNSGTMVVRASSDTSGRGWLHCDTTLHRIRPLGEDTLAVRMNAGPLMRGDHHALLNLDMNCGRDSLVRIPVKLTVIDTVPPAAIHDLVLSRSGGDTLLLTWSAPGDNRMSGCASAYEIYSTERPDVEIHSSSAVLLMRMKPDSAGQRQKTVLASRSLSGRCWVRIRTLDDAGLESYSNAVALPVFSPVGNGVPLPVRDRLYQNYPNPFNQETRMDFDLAKPSDVRVSVYDASGRRIRELCNLRFAAGAHSLPWVAVDENGKSLPTGVYLVRIETPDFREIKKMLLIR